MWRVDRRRVSWGRGRRWSGVSTLCLLGTAFGGAFSRGGGCGCAGRGWGHGSVGGDHGLDLMKVLQLVLLQRENQGSKKEIECICSYEKKNSSHLRISSL